MSLGSAIYPFGDMVRLPNIAGHRDAQATSCPERRLPLAPLDPSSGREARAKIYGGFPDIEPTPYREDMVFHLGFTERMIWSFRLSDNVDGSTLVSRSGTGTAATITWDRKRHNSYVEPGWYPVEFTAETPDGRTPRQASTAVLVFDRTFVDDDGSIHEFSIEDIAEGDHRGVWRDPVLPQPSRDSWADGELYHPGARPTALPDDWFDDDDDSVHDEAIDSIAEAGITKGFPNGTFRPDLAVTGGQMASFLARALDLPPSLTGSTTTTTASTTRRSTASPRRDNRRVQRWHLPPGGAGHPAQMASFLDGGSSNDGKDAGRHLGDLPGGDGCFPGRRRRPGRVHLRGGAGATASG